MQPVAVMLPMPYTREIVFLLFNVLRAFKNRDRLILVNESRCKGVLMRPSIEICALILVVRPVRLHFAGTARELPCAHGPSRAASSMLCERSKRADNKLDKWPSK